MIAGHVVCCESRRTPFHAHFIAIDDCSPCRRVRQLEAAGEAAIARGAKMARDFIAAGNSTGGAATAAASAAPSGQPDPAARIARAIMVAAHGTTIRRQSPDAVDVVESDLASEIRLALRCYR